MKSDSESKLANGALRLLARREHSRAELRRKLVHKGHPPELIDSALAQLETQGYLSDERFAEVFVHSRLNRGHGPLRIRRDLQERGIDAELIETYLPDDTEFWQSRAAELLSRKYPNPPDGPGPEWNRQARFLASRGFPTHVIYRLLKA